MASKFLSPVWPVKARLADSSESARNARRNQSTKAPSSLSDGISFLICRISSVSWYFVKGHLTSRKCRLHRYPCRPAYFGYQALFDTVRCLRGYVVIELDHVRICKG